MRHARVGSHSVRLWVIVMSRIQATISDGHLAHFQDECERLGISVSEVVRRVIDFARGIGVMANVAGRDARELDLRERLAVYRVIKRGNVALSLLPD